MRKGSGVFSYSFIGLGIVVGGLFLILESITIGLVYVALVGVALYLLLMNYCRKCPHSMNGTCHHWLPGRLAKKLPYKKTGKYTLLELAIVVVSIVMIFSLPIAYIYDNLIYLGVYLALWLIGVLLLRTKVCPNCYNRWCVICPNRVN